MRSEFGREKLVERQALLGAQAARLKQLAEAFRIPIVVTNQVTLARATENAFGGPAPPPDAGASDAHIAAALGTKWAHDVNTRLSLELTGGGERLLSVCARSATLLLRRACSRRTGRRTAADSQVARRAGAFVPVRRAGRWRCAGGRGARRERARRRLCRRRGRARGCILQPLRRRTRRALRGHRAAALTVRSRIGSAREYANSRFGPGASTPRRARTLAYAE